MGTIRFGTCSWNYDSWLGLVYSKPCRTAAEYLVEYSRKYRTAEIDSWFYKVPRRSEAEAYAKATDPDFRFTCKVPQRLTQVLLTGSAERNPDFLSVALYAEFLDGIEPLRERMELLIFEFEYMNKAKMSGLEEFEARFHAFNAAIPRDCSIGIECRNGNYLNAGYFDFLRDEGLACVFSEKQYMPPVAGLIGPYGDRLVEKVAVRLLGGDRKAIEEKAGQGWNRIAEEKDVEALAAWLAYLRNIGKRVTVNVNNHFEGSAPLSIGRLEGLVPEPGLGRPIS
jgi:uncharacterized protein YecE (DUF72 family)